MADLADIARTVIEAYSVLDLDTIASHFHDEFQIQILPASLGKPTRSKADYLAWLSVSTTAFKHLSLEILELLAGSDAITLHIRSHGEFVNGDPYLNEYIVIYRFKEDKIISMKEFMDSAYLLSVEAKMRS